MAPRVHGASAVGHAENAFLNGFLCVARAFDVPSTPHAENSQLFRGGPTRLTCSSPLYSPASTAGCPLRVVINARHKRECVFKNFDKVLTCMGRPCVWPRAHESVYVSVCQCVCVTVCESFILASFSMLFWFVWQQLGRDSGLPYGSRMIKLLPKIRCLSRCPFPSFSLPVDA